MGEIPDPAAVFDARPTGAPRNLALAGVKLGIEDAAKIIAVCADEHIRHHAGRCRATGMPHVGSHARTTPGGREAIAALERRHRRTILPDIVMTSVSSAAHGSDVSAPDAGPSCRGQRIAGRRQ